MSLSILFAKILGPYCLIVALGVLFNPGTYRKVMEDFLKNSALIYLAGVISLVLSLVIIQFHNVWVLDWPVAITVMGWLGMFKGVRLIMFPGFLPKTAEFYLKNQKLLTARLVLVLLIGAALTLFGYFIK